MTAVRVATRASLLARTQSEGVAAALRERLDGEVTLVEVTTQGDLDQRTPLAELSPESIRIFWPKGQFIRDALEWVLSF